MRLLGPIWGLLWRQGKSDHRTAPTHWPGGWYSWLQAGFWTTDLGVGAEPQIFKMPAGVPCGRRYKVNIFPRSIRAHIVMQIALARYSGGAQHEPQLLQWPQRAPVCASCLGITSASHTLGTPEGVGCHLPFSAKSSLEAQMSSVFWGVPEEISTVVRHRHHDGIWGSSGKVRGRASWLKRTPSACCLGGKISGGLSELALWHAALPGRRWNAGSGTINCSVRWGLSARRKAESIHHFYEVPWPCGIAKTTLQTLKRSLLTIILTIIRHVPSSFAEIHPG